LNARPLDYGLREAVRVPTNQPALQGALAGDGERLTGQDSARASLELVEEIPSRLYAMLRDRELDAALISSVECLRNPERFAYCATVGVCARREAYSIVYIRRRRSGRGADPRSVPARDFTTPVRRILADTGSRSSIALLQSLYFQANGVLPVIETESPERIAARLGPDDGGLLIGDGALDFLDRTGAESEPAFEILDLARWWHESEGLPFVFALWAYPIERPLADRVFEESLAAGEANMDRIIAAADRGDARSYLTDNLHYRLGPLELSALERFRQRLAEAGLLTTDRIQSGSP
ncbi:MAG: MqnA/MqnD/SBP family protein, partial [Leptospirales bacterium]